MKLLTDKLNEKLVNLECKLIGNRLTLLGRASLYSIIPIIDYIQDHNQTSEHAGAYTALVFSPILFWFGMEVVTGSGRATTNVYTRTKKHIKKYGKVGEKFAKKIFTFEGKSIKESEIDKKSPLGYCEWQGMYLASKALRKTKEFNELKEKYYHKIIPLV